MPTCPIRVILVTVGVLVLLLSVVVVLLFFSHGVPFHFLFLLHLLLLSSLRISVAQFVQFKRGSVLLSYVFHIRQTVKVVNEMKHLFVVWVFVEWNDGNTIVYLEGEGVN